MGCGSAAHRTLEETFEQIYTIEPTVNVTVSNGDGAVFVYGSNTNEMRMQAIKRAYTRERLKQIAVDELGAGEVVVDGMRGERMQARLGSGRMFAHNCFGNVALTLDRGTLTLAYDWWEPGKFSIQTNIAHGNAWAFLPVDIVCHLVAETGHGKIESDFWDSTQRGTKEVTKINMLIEGGGNAAVTMRAKEGDLRIVKTSP